MHAQTWKGGNFSPLVCSGEAGNGVEMFLFPWLKIEKGGRKPLKEKEGEVFVRTEPVKMPQR